MLLRDQAQQYKELHAPQRSSYLGTLCRNFIKYVAPSLMMLVLFSLAVMSFASEPATAAPKGFEQELSTHHKAAPSEQPKGFSANNMRRASPQGFGIEQSTSPNTVKGVLHNAKSNDYVVLEGTFIAPTEKSQHTYRFADAAGDTIEVDISESNNATAPQPNTKYYLWGMVSRDWFSTSINVIEFTPIG